MSIKNENSLCLIGIKCVELWQQNEDKNMHLKKRWRKTSISHIEYVAIPNIWIDARASQNK